MNRPIHGPVPDALLALWAKSSDLGGLPLPFHLLDVAAVCTEVLARMPIGSIGPMLDAIVPDDPEAARRWIAALVGLHDLGKATPGFQAKWEPGRRRAAATGFPFPSGAADRHDAATRALLPSVLRSRGASAPDARFLADAVAAHHGFKVPESESAAFSPIDAPAPPPWPDAQRSLASLLIDTVGAAGIPRVAPDRRGALWQWLAGVCAFCDWVGSSERFFPHDRGAGAPQDWYEHSRSGARAALDEIGWHPSVPSGGSQPVLAGDAALGLALPAGAAPRPLQRAVAGLLRDATSPALVLIEAPMGEGKTEAAYACHAMLAGVGAHRGLYVAMPTQATSNAIYGRTAGYLGRYGARSRVTLALVHGGASLEDTRLRLRDVGFGTADAAVQASAWFAGSRKGMLAESAVGTVDQALVGVLSARHAFVRLFGLSGRVVVLDEVHAYDDYTGGLLERLVAWLAVLGCSVVVMSATLPQARRSALARAWNPRAVLPDLPYPRACVIERSGVRGASFEAARSAALTVRPADASPEALARLGAGLVEGGGCAAIVVNTVARAQQVYTALAATPGVERLLFHARFPFEDRLRRERAVMARFGPGSDPATRDRVVLVATQVVEQSLDVDFDVMLSDLAPVDLLLQRAGRLHRHDRPRPPALSSPRLFVAGLGRSGVPPRAPRVVYDDLPVLRTAACLRSLDTIRLPGDIDALVQHVYGADPAGTDDAVLSAALVVAITEQAARERHLATLADQSALPLPADWTGGAAARPLDDADAEIAGPGGSTRLGEPSVQVVPIFDLADRWSVDAAGGMAWSKRAPIPPEARRALASRYLRLTLRDLRGLRQAGDSPGGWTGHPALVGLIPLRLDAAGAARGPRLALRLDAELGLVIERNPS